MLMILKRWPIALLMALLLVGNYATAQEFGTADEAKGMLERAVAALEADKEKALADFTAGAEGFKEKDLYVFCGGPDGNFTAHGANDSLVGKSLKDLKDKADKAFGEEMYSNAAEGSIAEVEYMFPKPGEEEPSEKISFVTMVSDQVCGVGYYK